MIFIMSYDDLAGLARCQAFEQAFVKKSCPAAAARGPARADRRTGRPADRQHRQRQTAARLAAAHRTGNDRRHRRQPHRRARGGGRLEGRPPGDHPPGRRRLRRGTGAAAVPGGFRRALDAARGAQRHGTAHRRRGRGGRPCRRTRLGAQVKKIADRFARDQRRYRPRRECGRPGLRLPLRNRRFHRQSAIQALPGISRPLHHSAADRVGPLGAANQTHPTRRIPAGARADTQRDPRARGDAGARRHAAASGQQPQPLRKDRGRRTGSSSFAPERSAAAITRESNAKNSGYRSRGRRRHAAAQADEGPISEHPLERHPQARRCRRGRRLRRPPISPTSPRWKKSSPASKASSISAATRSKARGRRSSTPTSSAATICSRRRAAPASSAWCSPPPITRWASTRARSASASTSPCARTAVTA